MKIRFFLAFVLFSLKAFSAVNSSPYDVVYNHLFYLQEENYNPERSAASFDTESENAVKAATKLKRILDGRGVFIEMETIPNGSNHFDSASGTYRYVLDASLPQVFVSRKSDGKWFYSKPTLEAIPDLFSKTYPFGSQWDSYFTAPFWRESLLGLKIYQWFELIILGLLAFISFWIFGRVFYPILKNLAKLNLGLRERGVEPLKKLARVLSLWITTKLISWVLPTLLLAPKVNSFFIKGLGVLSIFFGVFVAVQILEVLFVYLSKRAEETETTMDDQLVPVLRRIGQIAVWSAGLIMILNVLDVNVTALLAGISIGGLAIALAAQDTVRNFFGSVMIFLDRPFQIGDWIHFDNVDGIVEEVGVRATRIRTFANSITYVPNGMLANQIVDNMGLRTYRRFKTEIGVTYDTDPELIELFVDGIREIILMHPTSRKDYFEVHLNSFGPYSLNILLYAFFEAPSWTDELKGRHDVMQAILTLASEMGIRFAFPTQTIHMEEFPGKMSTTPSKLSGSDADIARKRAIERVKTQFEKRKTANLDKIKPLGGE